MADNPENEKDDETEVDSAVGTLVTVVVDVPEVATQVSAGAPQEDIQENGPGEADEAGETPVETAEASEDNAGAQVEASAEETKAPTKEGTEKKNFENDSSKNLASEDDSGTGEAHSVEEERKAEIANPVRLRNGEERVAPSIEQVMIKSLREQNKELEEKLKELRGIAASHRLAKEQEASLRKQLEALAEEKAKMETQHEEALAEMERIQKEELVGYKEQIRQHSLTIVGMEDRISRANRQSQENDLTTENQRATVIRLQNRVKELEDRLEAGEETDEPEDAGASARAVDAYSPKDIYAMEQLIHLLRRESADLRVALKDRDAALVALRKDLAGAQAKLSDMTGELSEEQKVMIENLQEAAEEHYSELCYTREKLASLSEVVDKQTKEIESLNADALAKSKEIAKTRAETNSAEKRATSLREEVDALKRERAAMDEKRSENQSLTKELANIGAQCRGERHNHVIQRQREALSEMRAKIKSLELGRPPPLAKDEALQQVAVLKRELSELRAQQALTDNKSLERVAAGIFRRSAEKSLEEGEEEKLAAAEDVTDRGEMMTSVATATRAEFELEKSAHRETIHALETSERAYFNVVRAAASALDVDATTALKSMSYAAKEDREKLFKDRQRLAEAVGKSAKTLTDNWRKAEAAVASYAAETRRLKDIEETSESLKGELEAMAKNLQKEFDDNKLLREALRRSKESLNYEKRLNASIKEKKQFYVENPRAGGKGGGSTPSGQSAASIGKELEKEVGKRKSLQEAMKRKEEEVRSLKMEMNKMRTVQMDSIKRRSYDPDRY